MWSVISTESIPELRRPAKSCLGKWRPSRRRGHRTRFFRVDSLVSLAIPRRGRPLYIWRQWQEAVTIEPAHELSRRRKAFESDFKTSIGARAMIPLIPSGKVEGGWMPHFFSGTSKADPADRIVQKGFVRAAPRSFVPVRPFRRGGPAGRGYC